MDGPYVCWLSRSDQGCYEFSGLLLVYHKRTKRDYRRLHGVTKESLKGQGIIMLPCGQLKAGGRLTIPRLICTLIFLGCRRALIFLGYSLDFFLIYKYETPLFSSCPPEKKRAGANLKKFQTGCRLNSHLIFACGYIWQVCWKHLKYIYYWES